MTRSGSSTRCPKRQSGRRSASDACTGARQNPG
jgi:hypothetical protein